MPPPIKVRGAARSKGIPSGYIMGRSSAGTGDVELLRINDLRRMGVAGHADVSAPNGVTPGAYTNANITVDASGRVTAAANGGGGGGGSFNKSIPNGFTLIPPVAANFTFQQSGTTHGAIADLGSGKGITFGQSVGNASTAYFFLADQAVLSQSAFTVTALVHFTGQGMSDNLAWGISLRDNGGKVYEWGFRNNTLSSAEVSEFEYNPFSTFTTSIVNGPGAFAPNELVWLRLQLTGGNFIFSMSWDGENYFVMSTRAQAGFFLSSTLVAVGFHSFNASGVQPLRFNVYHYTNTTP